MAKFIVVDDSTNFRVWLYGHSSYDGTCSYVYGSVSDVAEALGNKTYCALMSCHKTLKSAKHAAEKLSGNNTKSIGAVDAAAVIVASALIARGIF